MVVGPARHPREAIEPEQRERGAAEAAREAHGDPGDPQIHARSDGGPGARP